MTDIPHPSGAVGSPFAAERAREIAAAIRASRWTPRAALAAVVGLAAVINLWQLSGNGYGNTFYAAAVRSATFSWKNWFFGSFDPGGFITVDKPPVFLWFGGLAARIFGYSSWTILAPSAIAGALTVGLIWWIVRRYFGAFAATIAAIALILTPISVAVDRLNLPEPFYILALVGAAAAVLRSLESRRWWAWTIFAGVLVGVAFNTKMLAAWIPGPALALALVIGDGDSWRRPAIRRILGRLAVLAAATFIVSFSWMVIVDALPASSRPYIGGSTNNTVSNLAFDYNGFGRVEGENNRPGGGGNRGGFPGGGRNFIRPNGGNGGGFPGNFFGNGGTGNGGGSNGTAPNGRGGTGGGFPGNFFGNGGAGGNGTAPNSTGGGGLPRFNSSSGGAQPPSNGNTTAPGAGGSTQAGPGGNGRPTGFPGAGGNATGAGGIIAGSPGLWRMFDDANGGQVGWLLPFALLGAAASLWYWRRDRVRRAAVITFAGWVLLFGLVFSFAQGIYHSYYTSALAPGIAALVGMSAIAFVGLFRQNRLWIIPFCGVVAVTIAVQLTISGRFDGFEYGVRPYVIPLAVVGVVLLASAVMIRRIPATLGMCWVLAGLLLIPGAWSQFEVLHTSANTTLPQAGPRQGASTRSFGSAAFDDGTTSLANWLLAHRESGTKWDLAVSSSMNASTLIAEHNLSVMAIGGFNGSDPTITAGQFADLVQAGEIRYVETGGRGGFGGFGGRGFGATGGNSADAKGANAVMAAVESACTPVTGDGLPQNEQGSIYDCAGAAAKIRAAASGPTSPDGAS